MNTKYEVIYEPSLKAMPKKEEDLVADNIDNMSKNPIYKAVIPQYMYKPFWGYPRYQPLGFLREIAKNVYASSVMKQVKDLVIDTPFDLALNKGVDMTPELEELKNKHLEFINKPNPDEEFDDFTRKWLDDAFKYDSGIINKVFNPLGELLQLRVADGATFKKNPDKHGYIDNRVDIIYDKSPVAGTVPKKEDYNRLANNFDSIYSDTAAYFQYVNNVASQIPIPFGKKEIAWITFNPSSDNVYTNGSYLEDTIDLLLSLVYGIKYNLDFYQNGNTPEGIINAMGASKKDLLKIKEQLNHSIKSPRDSFGMSRRVGYRMPVVNMENLDFIKLNLTSQEMEIINQQKWFTKIFFMRFGLNADELGFTEDSNRATSTQQSKNAKRKALAPIYKKIENMYNYQILPHLEKGNLFKFKFDFYDVVEEKTKRELQQLEINMGINTPQMIAEEEGIDYKAIQDHKEENMTTEFQFSETNLMNDKELSQEEKNQLNQKQEENKETKSMGASIGGEGTEDSVMNPIQGTTKKKGMPKQTALEVTMTDYEQEFKDMVKKVIDSVK